MQFGPVELTLIYLFIINIMTFFIYRRDAAAARESDWYVSERNMLLLALIGGSLGGWRALLFYQHKKYASKFRGKFYNIVLLHLVLFGAFIYLVYFS